jgi:hypothetical protein
MKIFGFLFICALLLMFNVNAVFAQTLLPKPNAAIDCNQILTDFEIQGTPGDWLGDYDNQDILGCAIKTGKVSLNMIPYFIRYVADFLLGLSGLISMLFVVVGGFMYVWGGLTDQKEKGKKTIMNALMGLGIAILSWSIIAMIIAAITG